MSGSIYQIGVHLTAKDGVSGVLANISKSLLGLHGGVEHLQKGFNSLQVGLLGAAAVAAGVKIGHVVEKLVGHGMELRHWQAQMVAAGATSKTVAEMTAKAWEVAGKNLNTTATDNMKNIIELNKVTADWHESARLLPIFSNVETVLAAVKANGMHSGITGNSTQTLNFARGLEELGVTTARKKSNGTLESPEEVEERIQKYTQGFIKAMQVSRGLFDGNQLYSSTNNSAGAAQNWDFRMATTIAPVIGEIMKAGKFGNADYMTLKSFQGGHITGDAAEALFKYHLVKADDLKRNEKGKVVGLNANTDFAKGMDTNLWEWANKVLETLRKSGMNTEDQSAVNRMINEIGSNKSNSGILRALLEPHEHAQIAKELGQMDKVPNDVASLLNQNDPFIKLQNLQKKWDDFLTALGGPLVDPAMRALDGMTSTINKAAQYLAAHPDVAAKIGDTLVGLSIGLTALGTVLIGGAVVAALGTGGWLVLGITALATAFRTFAPAQFSEWLAGFKTLCDGIIHFDWGKIKSGVTQEFDACMNAVKDGFTAAIARLPDQLTNIITTAFGRIGDLVKGALGLDGAKSGAAKPGVVGPSDPGYDSAPYIDEHGNLHKSSYRGGSVFGGNLIPASYTGAANDNGIGVIAAGTKAGFLEAMGVTGGGGGSLGGGAGGIIRASYGAGDVGTFLGGSDGGTAIGKTKANANSLAISAELVKAGLPAEGVAAAMGSMQAESGFNPTILDRLTHTHKGLIQWDRSRWSHVSAWIRARGGNPEDATWQARAFVAEGRAHPGDPLYNGSATAAGFAALERAHGNMGLALHGMQQIERYDHEAGRGAAVPRIGLGLDDRPRRRSGTARRERDDLGGGDEGVDGAFSVDGGAGAGGDADDVRCGINRSNHDDLLRIVGVRAVSVFPAPWRPDLFGVP